MISCHHWNIIIYMGKAWVLITRVEDYNMITIIHKHQLVPCRLIMVKIITLTLVSLPKRNFIINKTTHPHSHLNKTNKKSTNPQQWQTNNSHIFHLRMLIQRKKVHTVSIIIKVKSYNPNKLSKWSRNFLNLSF